MAIRAPDGANNTRTEMKLVDIKYLSITHDCGLNQRTFLLCTVNIPLFTHSQKLFSFQVHFEELFSMRIVLKL